MPLSEGLYAPAGRCCSNGGQRLQTQSLWGPGRELKMGRGAAWGHRELVPVENLPKLCFILQTFFLW